MVSVQAFESTPSITPLRRGAGAPTASALLLLVGFALPAVAVEISVEIGTGMRYLANSSDPGIGLGWVQPDFDDSQWKKGTYGVGYDTGNRRQSAAQLLRTRVPAGVVSIYTRVTFTVKDPRSVKNLFFGADYDDGVVAWLNGVEVYRSPQMPSGQLKWDTRAQPHESSNGGRPLYSLRDISRPGIAALRPGQNVLAVGVWNDMPRSSDLVLVPKLVMNESVATWERVIGRNAIVTIRSTRDGGYILIEGTKLTPERRGKIVLTKLGRTGHPVWTRVLGGSEEWTGSDVRETRDGGFIVSGSSGGRRDLRILLLRTNNDGQKLWSSSFGEGLSGSSAHEAKDGGFIAVGSSYPGNTENTLVVRTDEDGRQVSRWTLGVSGGWNTGVLEPCRDGGFVFLGNTRPHPTLARLSTTGEPEWEKRLSPAVAGNLVGAVETKDGSFAIAGTTASGDFTLLKADATGETLWQRSFGGPKRETCFGLARGPGESLILCGVRGNNIILVRVSGSGEVEGESARIGSFNFFGSPPRGGSRMSVGRDGSVVVAANRGTTPFLQKSAPIPAAAPAADLVSYKGRIYFRRDPPPELVTRILQDAMPGVPTEHRRGAFLESVPCRVLAGPASHVYLVSVGRYSVGESENHGESPRAVRLAALDQELKSLRDERSALAELRSASRERLRSRELAAAERKALEEEVRQIDAKSMELGQRMEDVRSETARLNSELRRESRPRMVTRYALVGRLLRPGTVKVAAPGPASVDSPGVGFELVGEPETIDRPTPWLKKWAQARIDGQRFEGHDPEWNAYLARHIRERFELTPSASAARRPRVTPRVRGGVHPYDLFTGSAAIRESIQLDRVLDLSTGDPKAASVDVSSIQALALKDHPFDEMRADRSFRGSELARVCPKDAMYVRVRSLKDWFRVQDLINRWGGGFLSNVQVRGQDYDLAGRYTRQLGLDGNLLSRLLGSSVIGEFVVILSDPLLAGGSAVAVVFSPLAGKTDAFDSLFATRRKARAVAHPQWNRKSVRVAGLDAQLEESADGSVRSYALKLGVTRIFTNSPELLGRVVQASRDPSVSLHAAADYRYYRSLYPLDDKETGFLYLSQDWFRRITSPAWRIAHGRRRAVASLMRDVRFGWQLALEERETPKLEALLPLVSPPASIAQLGIKLDPETGTVASQSHGTLDTLRPVDERLPDTATVEESQLYGQFRQSYERYWRQFIDPVGIRFELDDDELSVDTLILPLIENTIYRELRELAGGQVNAVSPTVALPSEALAATTLRWSPEHRMVRRFFRDLFGRRASRAGNFDPSWFGRMVSLGVADGDLFLTASPGGSPFATRMFGGGVESLAGALAISSLTLPIFAAVEVKDEAAVEAFLDQLLALAAAHGGREVGVHHYSAPGKPRIHTVRFTLFIVDLRIHYAIAEGWLLASTRIGLLERWLAKLQKNAQGEPFGANGRLSLFPRAFEHAARTIGIVWQEQIAGACHANLAPLRRAARAGWFDRSEAFLGYRAFCPEGGKYAFADDEARCSLHGTARKPLQPRIPPATAPTVRLVNDMKEVKVDFEFAEDGLRSSVRLRFDTKE